MPETWLRPNRRALAIGAVPPGVMAAGGLLIASGVLVENIWLRVAGGVVGVLGGFVCAFLLWQMRQPRVAFQDGHVLVFLQAGEPLRVPLEVVEAFFIGSGPSLLPGRNLHEARTTNLVICLADNAQAWRHREVKHALGSWCDGYVTLRGTWCEPVTVELAKQLNRRLEEVRRQSRGERTTA